MADRRRRPHSEAESDEESTETSSSRSPRKARQSECESEGDTKEGDLEVSDYESANEENEEEEEEEEESEEEEEEDDDDEEYEDEDVVVEDYEEVGEERQSGDGEEQPDNQKLDDDEDRKNPAFIPRQGAFYEHDLRLGEELEDGDKRPKKKLWQDEGKWIHDKYSDYMQSPKTREELITMYGYDIRQSDKPPDAPPRRGGGAPRRPRYGDKSRFGDFMPSSRDDSYIVDKRNDYNRNRDRYFRGKSEEYRRQDEERGPPPHHSNEDQEYEEQKYQPEKFDEWNSRFEENQSYRGRGRGGRSSYRGQDSGRGYGRNRNYDNRDSNRGYDNRESYDRPPRRDYDSRPPRYDRGYRNDDYQRGGRYNSRGYRHDPPRREFSRGSRGGRSRPDRGRGGPPRRNTYEERKIPPRFLKKKEARMQQQTGYNPQYVDPTYYEDYGDSYQDIPAEELVGQHVVIQTEVFTPGHEEEPVQEVAEGKQEEKNENVIVQSSASERKSYSKERRVRTVGKTRVQESALNAVQEGIGQMQLEAEGQTGEKKSPRKDRGDHKSKGSHGQDGGRTKRYSSQRQRNPEQGDSQQFYQEPPKGYPKQEVPGPQFQQQMMRPAINFPIPVSTTALPNGPPQRLFRPPPVPGGAAVPIIGPQFINPNVIYGAPPGPGPFPVAPIQGFPSPPPVSTAPPQIPVSSAEVYRHGTTYYAPELQYPQMKKRSPAKRTKSAIPIVNPQEVPVGTDVEQSQGEVVEPVDDRDAKLQESIDREYGVEDPNVPYVQKEAIVNPPSEKTCEENETLQNIEDDLDSISSRLSTKASNYTIAFSTEQELGDKGDNPSDISQGQSSSAVEVQESLSPEKSSAVMESKESISPKESSLVPEGEKIVTTENSSVAGDNISAEQAEDTSQNAQEKVT